MVEAQAAARVDRLDQTKDIVIYRYIVKESIEEVRLPHRSVQFTPALLTALEQNIQKSQRHKLLDAELSHSSMAAGFDPDEDGSVLVGLTKSNSCMADNFRDWESSSKNITTGKNLQKERTNVFQRDFGTVPQIVATLR